MLSAGGQRRRLSAAGSAQRRLEAHVAHDDGSRLARRRVVVRVRGAGHDDVARAYDRTISACRDNGKHCGMGGIYDEVLAEKFIRMGARLVLAGSDLSFLMAAARARAGFMARLAGG